MTTTAPLVPLVYVGNKPAAYDNIARTGLTWNGYGDVQEVTEAQAKLLLKFPDQWAVLDEADTERATAPTSVKVVDEDGEAIIVNPDAFQKPLEKMTKTEMVAYARDRWGRLLDIGMAKKMMIDQIEEWDRELDMLIGAQSAK